MRFGPIRALGVKILGMFAALLGGCDECVGLSGADLSQCCNENPGSGSCGDGSCRDDAGCNQGDAGVLRCTVGANRAEDCFLSDGIELQVFLQPGEVAAERYQFPLPLEDGAVEVTLRYLAPAMGPGLRATVTDEMGGLVGVLDVVAGSERIATFGMRAGRAYALSVEASPSMGGSSYSVSAKQTTRSVEIEPNDTPLSAHLLQHGATVSGGLSNRTSSDSDYFSFVSPADARRFTMEVVRTDASLGAATLSVLDADEGVLAQRQVGAEAERVIVGVRPGEQYYARVGLEGTTSGQEYDLSFTFSPSYFEMEPNDAFSSATQLVSGVEMFGAFAEKGAIDQDLFELASSNPTEASTTVTFNIESFLAVRAAPISVSVMDAQGSLLQSASIAPMSSQAISGVPAGTGSVFISLSGPRDLTSQAYRLVAMIDGL